MPVSIMTNEIAMGAQRNLATTTNKLNNTMKRLSSGSRIVQASDDPAGLAISDQMQAQIRSLGQAVRNAQDGMSLIQVYEGGTNEINNMLMRVRELAMQSSSDTVGDEERDMINDEAQQLLSEVTRVARSTKFAGTELLSGAMTDLDFQVGTGNNGDVDRIKFAPGETDLTADGLNVSGVNLEDKGNAQNSLETLDDAIQRVNAVRARVGATSSRLMSTMESQGIYQENMMAARSRIRDADFAQESANLAQQQILQQAGAAVAAQANQAPAIALKMLG